MMRYGIPGSAMLGASKGRRGWMTPARAIGERDCRSSEVRSVPIEEHLAWLRDQGRGDEASGIRRIPPKAEDPKDLEVRKDFQEEDRRW